MHRKRKTHYEDYMFRSHTKTESGLVYPSYVLYHNFLAF